MIFEGEFVIVDFDWEFLCDLWMYCMEDFLVFYKMLSLIL